MPGGRLTDLKLFVECFLTPRNGHRAYARVQCPWSSCQLGGIHRPHHRIFLRVEKRLDNDLATGAYDAVQLFGRTMSQPIAFQLTNHTDTTIMYTIESHTCPLPPRTTRTHQPCRPPEVTFQWPGTPEPTTVHPNHGDRYTIVRGTPGRSV